MASPRDMPKIGDLSCEDFFSKLDEKIKSLATKADLNKLQGSIEELRKENLALKREIETLKRREEETTNQLDELINRSRRNNIIFRGVKIVNKEYETGIKDFCVNVMKCNAELFVNRAHPLRAYSKDATPPIIAHIPRDRDIHDIFKHVKNLKDTGVVIHRDFSKIVRQKRFQLMKIKRKVDEVSSNAAKTKLVYDHLYVDNLRYDWHSEHGLIHGDRSGIRMLSDVFQYDFQKLNQELLNKARNSQPNIKQSKAVLDHQNENQEPCGSKK